MPCVNKSKQEGEMKSMCRLVFWVGILCLRIVVAQADTIPCYDSLKLQLHEQSLPLINLVVDIDHVSKPTYTPAFVEICDPMKRMGGDGVTLLACKVKYRGNTSIMIRNRLPFRWWMVKVKSSTPTSLACEGIRRGCSMPWPSIESVCAIV